MPFSVFVMLPFYVLTSEDLAGWRWDEKIPAKHGLHKFSCHAKFARANENILTSQFLFWMRSKHKADLTNCFSPLEVLEYALFCLYRMSTPPKQLDRNICFWLWLQARVLHARQSENRLWRPFFFGFGCNMYESSQNKVSSLLIPQSTEKRKCSAISLWSDRRNKAVLLK